MQRVWGQQGSELGPVGRLLETEETAGQGRCGFEGGASGKERVITGRQLLAQGGQRWMIVWWVAYGPANRRQRAEWT